MDRILDSGSNDKGSIPFGSTISPLKLAEFQRVYYFHEAQKSTKQHTKKKSKATH